MSATDPPRFSPGQLEQIAKALGDTDAGLTGSEIAQVLAQARIKDIDPRNTKWRRIYNALTRRHNMDRSGGRTLAFIRFALDPARYAGRQPLFELRRRGVNSALGYVGLEFRDDGRFHRCKPTASLSEAEARADRLRTLLEAREVHGDVLAFCRAELVKDNYFHAVLEAAKSISAKIRKRTRLDLDGAALFDAALGGSAPMLRINPFSSESERGEQRGFLHLLKGLQGTFRNPTAHAPRREWPMAEEDALDLLSTASYVHRRLDAAV